MGFEKDINMGTWYIKTHKTPHVQRTEEMEARDEHLELYRRYIEQAFGDVKARFHILFQDFRHDRNYLGLMLRFCCAIHNLILDYFHKPDNFSSVWSGPIPRLDPPRTRKV